MTEPVHLCVPREFDVSDFWHSVYRISEEHRRIPAQLRAMSGVHRGEFHAERMVGQSSNEDGSTADDDIEVDPC